VLFADQVRTSRLCAEYSTCAITAVGYNKSVETTLLKV